jgi:hypothetical protein
MVKDQDLASRLHQVKNQQQFNDNDHHLHYQDFQRGNSNQKKGPETEEDDNNNIPKEFLGMGGDDDD